jgi:hypothetical protein
MTCCAELMSRCAALVPIFAIGDVIPARGRFAPMGRLGLTLLIRTARIASCLMHGVRAIAVADQTGRWQERARSWIWVMYRNASSAKYVNH